MNILNKIVVFYWIVEDIIDALFLVVLSLRSIDWELYKFIEEFQNQFITGVSSVNVW